MENLRLDGLFVMSEGGNAVSLDELNDFLNIWNRSCIGVLNFGKACDCFKHITMMRKCAYEAFGKKYTRSDASNQEVAISRIVVLFEQADVFF